MLFGQKLHTGIRWIAQGEMVHSMAGWDADAQMRAATEKVARDPLRGASPLSFHGLLTGLEPGDPIDVSEDPMEHGRPGKCLQICRDAGCIGGGV